MFLPGCLFWRRICSVPDISSFAKRLAESRLDIVLHQLFQDLVTFYFHDKASRALIARNIGRIAGHDIADDLVDRVIPFFGQCFVDFTKDLANLHFFVFLYCLKILCITDIAHKYPHVLLC